MVRVKQVERWVQQNGSFICPSSHGEKRREISSFSYHMQLDLMMGRNHGLMPDLEQETGPGERSCTSHHSVLAGFVRDYHIPSFHQVFRKRPCRLVGEGSARLLGTRGPGAARALHDDLYSLSPLGIGTWSDIRVFASTSTPFSLPVGCSARIANTFHCGRLVICGGVREYVLHVGRPFKGSTGMRTFTREARL